MGTFLLLCVLGLVAFVVVGAILSAVLHAVVWLVTLPFRIFFKLLFGLGRHPRRARPGAIHCRHRADRTRGRRSIGAVLAMLAPLLPVLLLGGFAWAIFRLASRKPAPPPPPPPAGFWS